MFINIHFISVWLVNGHLVGVSISFFIRLVFRFAILVL
jgi:hypothetical protein